MSYVLIATDTSEFGGECLHITELSAENIVDIQAALRSVDIRTSIHKGECFPETKAKVRDVPVPDFDY